MTFLKLRSTNFADGRTNEETDVSTSLYIVQHQLVDGEIHCRNSNKVARPRAQLLHFLPRPLVVDIRRLVIPTETYLLIRHKAKTRVKTLQALR